MAKHIVYVIDLTKEMNEESHPQKIMRDNLFKESYYPFEQKINVLADKPREEWDKNEYIFFERLLQKPYIRSGIKVFPLDEMEGGYRGICVVPNDVRAKAWRNIAEKYGVDCIDEDNFNSVLNEM